MFIVLGIYNFGKVMSNHVLFLPKIVHQCWLDERLNPWWLDWKLNWYVFSIFFLVFIHFFDKLKKWFYIKRELNINLQYKTLILFSMNLNHSKLINYVNSFWYQITALDNWPTLLKTGETLLYSIVKSGSARMFVTRAHITMALCAELEFRW